MDGDAERPRDEPPADAGNPSLSLRLLAGKTSVHFAQLCGSAPASCSAAIKSTATGRWADA